MFTEGGKRAFKIKRSSVSDQIFEELKNRIVSREWVPGDKIPSETDIAEMFGVSRLSARTAIQRLSALGLIDIRVGDGTYVKESPVENYLDNGAELLGTIQQMDELAQFREYFEAAVMDAACKCRTEEDIDYVKVLLGNMYSAAEKGDTEEFHKSDHAFHEGLCRITGNRYFELVYKLIGKSLAEHFRESTEKYSHLPGVSDDPASDKYYLKELCRGHEDYIRALEAKNPALVFDNLNGYLEAYKAERHRLDQFTDQKSK